MLFLDINQKNIDMTRKVLYSIFIAFLCFGLTLHAQSLKTPAPSPTQSLKQNFGLGEISLEYSRPSTKGRVIFGDLVPYGKIWRTGANASTKITFTDDVMVEGKAVNAGTYALYTIPGKDNWEILLYKDLTLGGGVNNYNQADELMRVNVKPTALSQKIETFTIEVADVMPTSCTIELLWDQVRVPIKVTTDIDAKVMKNIEKVMSPGDNRPYYAAASYYYENNKDMKQALEWVNKAVDQNPKAFWVYHLKAKIQIKLKDAKGAIETAEKSKALAMEAKDDTYVKNNDKLIAEAKTIK